MRSSNSHRNTIVTEQNRTSRKQTSFFRNITTEGAPLRTLSPNTRSLLRVCSADFIFLLAGLHRAPYLKPSLKPFRIPSVISEPLIWMMLQIVVPLLPHQRSRDFATQPGRALPSSIFSRSSIGGSVIIGGIAKEMQLLPVPVVPPSVVFSNHG